MNIFFSVWNCVFSCFECFYNWILIPKMALSVLKGLTKLKVTFFLADIFKILWLLIFNKVIFFKLDFTLLLS